MQQWSMTDAIVFGAVYVWNGAIVAETTAPVFTYASIIDNQSGDAMFVRGVAAREATPTPLQ